MLEALQYPARAFRTRLNRAAERNGEPTEFTLSSTCGHDRTPAGSGTYVIPPLVLSSDGMTGLPRSSLTGEMLKSASIRATVVKTSSSARYCPGQDLGRFDNLVSTNADWAGAVHVPPSEPERDVKRVHRVAAFLPKPPFWLEGVGIGIVLLRSQHAPESYSSTHQPERARQQSRTTRTRNLRG